MKYVALTGNKYSGKKTVCKAFEKLGVPIFDADLISRYMIHHKSDVIEKVIEKFGRDVYRFGSLNTKFFKDNDKFDDLMNIIEFDVIKAFQYWSSGKNNNHYCIFKYSLLFERKINTSFDLIINAYAPLGQRAERISDDKDYDLADTIVGLYDELDELTKNEKSDMVIHNYATFNVDKQVRQANANIISSSKEFMNRLVF